MRLPAQVFKEFPLLSPFPARLGQPGLFPISEWRDHQDGEHSSIERAPTGGSIPGGYLRCS